MKQEREYLEQYNIRTIPITDMLHYSYDYGDGWKVLISCEMAYSIGGFCEMLKTIYEADIYDEEAMEERDNMLGWACMMGWTGRN